MTLVYLSILLIVIFSAIYLRQDLVSPSRIYLGVYSLLLVVYSLNLSRLQTPWSTTSSILFYGATGMFLFGNIAGSLVASAQNTGWTFSFKELKDRLHADAETVDWTWVYRVFFVSFSIFIISFLVSYAITGEIPMFSSNPDKSRIRFFLATGPTSHGLFFGPISMMIAAQILFLGRISKVKKRTCIFAFTLTLLLFLTLVTRFDLFRFIIFFVVIYHYASKNLNLKHIVSGFLVLLILFLAAFFVRANLDAVGTFNEMVKIKLPKNIAWASNIYAYVANNFWNFDFAVRKFVEGDNYYPFQYGVGLFRAPLYLTRLEGTLDLGYGFDTIMNESIQLVKGLNTTIYVWHLYKDFGITGVFLLSLFGGIFLSIFYQNFIRQPSVFLLGIWGIIVGIILLSYHVPLWEFWYIYLNLLMMAITFKRIRLF